MVSSERARADFQLEPICSISLKYSTMSDREGHSGNGAPTDEDLSLPKATVAKMIAGV